MKYKELVEEFGEDVANKICLKHGGKVLYIPNGVKRAQRNDEMMKMYNNGFPINTLASLFNITPMQVRRVVQR